VKPLDRSSISIRALEVRADVLARLQRAISRGDRSRRFTSGYLLVAVTAAKRANLSWPPAGENATDAAGSQQKSFVVLDTTLSQQFD
jgi:hypothetical protein